MKLTTAPDMQVNATMFSGRTFPQHPYFQRQLGAGQLSLFNVLKAYSLRDEQVGYCQGLGFVAGILLMHVSVKYSGLFLVTCVTMTYKKLLLSDILARILIIT